MVVFKVSTARKVIGLFVIEKAEIVDYFWVADIFFD